MTDVNFWEKIILEGQAGKAENDKKTVVYEQDACNAKVSRLQVVPNRNRGASSIGLKSW